MTITVIAIVILNERIIEPFLQVKLEKSDQKYQQMLEVLFKHHPSFSLKILLIAPLAEEVMVRGLLQGIVLFPNNGITALLAAALLFSIIHINPYQVMASMVPSLLLGVIYYITQALLLCIALHFAMILYSLYQLRVRAQK